MSRAKFAMTLSDKKQIAHITPSAQPHRALLIVATTIATALACTTSCRAESSLENTYPDETAQLRSEIEHYIQQENSRGLTTACATDLVREIRQQHIPLR